MLAVAHNHLGEDEYISKEDKCDLILKGYVAFLDPPKDSARTDAELAEAAESTRIFARLSPEHKQGIVRAFQHKGPVVGFMGDGINDAPALHGADLGISADSPVDIAKAAAVILNESCL